MITLTTVGCGDTHPITVAGKVFGGDSAILGVGMCALPAAIVASACSEQEQDNNRISNCRPHCGTYVDHN